MVFKKLVKDLGYKVKRLDAIGFNWNPRKSIWEESLELLLLFKHVFGHCNVPKNFSDKRLSYWVYNLRRRPPSESRIKKLNEIGFVWAFKVEYLAS